MTIPIRYRPDIIVVSGLFYAHAPSTRRAIVTISIGIDRSHNPPVLRINGHALDLKAVALLSPAVRKQVRKKLAGMPDGSKLVAYTMKGAALPSK